MKKLLGFIVLACLLVACGGTPDEGPKLGDFPAISKKEGDAPFKITPPSSRSPVAFTFTSSNPAVATIDGDTVTIKGPGDTTITAAQAASGTWGPTQKSTTLTVAAVPCATGQTRIDGVCTAIPTCISPAALSNNRCVAPASSAATIASGNRIWMGVTNSYTWADAKAFCEGSVIEGQTGWRLPTSTELSALYASNAYAGKNWVLGNTWTSTLGTTASASSRVTVDLATGTLLERSETAGSYATCVR